MCSCLSLSPLRAHHSQHTLTTPGDLSTYRDIFEQYKRGNGTLGLNELADLFLNVSKKITALPATAQVASQQGAYLGKKFAKLGRQELDDTALRNGVYDDPDDLLADPFNYRHLGSLAYIVRSLSASSTWRTSADPLSPCARATRSGHHRATCVSLSPSRSRGAIR